MITRRQYLKLTLAAGASLALPAGVLNAETRHMIDNMRAAYGELPDADVFKRMAAHIESL